MMEIALANINSFASEANTTTQNITSLKARIEKLEQENEQLNDVLENTLRDSISILETLTEFASKKKILASRETKTFLDQCTNRLLEVPPTERTTLLNAYIKKLFLIIGYAWDLNLPGPIAMTPTEKRAWTLIDHFASKDVTALTTQECQLIIEGSEGMSISRSQTKRAMEKATRINQTIELEKVPDHSKNQNRLVLRENAASDCGTMNMGLRTSVVRTP